MYSSEKRLEFYQSIVIIDGSSNTPIQILAFLVYHPAAGRKRAILCTAIAWAISLVVSILVSDHFESTEFRTEWSIPSRQKRRDHREKVLLDSESLGQ